MIVYRVKSVVNNYMFIKKVTNYKSPSWNNYQIIIMAELKSDEKHIMYLFITISPLKWNLIKVVVTVKATHSTILIAPFLKQTKTYVDLESSRLI